MSYTAHQLLGLIEHLHEFGVDVRAQESYDSRLRALAAYLIGRFV